MSKSKIKVLIVDDSAVVRKVLTNILSTDNEIEVIGTAADPIVAVNKMAKQAPDVITLDVEMPRMDGISFLKKIMSQHPLPVVICSSLVEQGSQLFNQALEYGAAEIILKPELNSPEQVAEAKIIICDAVKAAALTKPIKLTLHRRVKSSLLASKRYDADVILKAGIPSKRITKKTENIVVIGASTGGTQALLTFLAELPSNAPGIIVVQHMPKGFTRSFADRLDSLCKVNVKEACHGDIVKQGQVLIAPGDKHMLCRSLGKEYFVEIKKGPLVSRHRPSVDVLFRSAARYAGKNAIGIIMTGMGDDGAKGMKEMHDTGARTIAQDEATSIVFGMPKEAVLHGGVDEVLPLEKIADRMLSIVK